jgi:SnoaL-like protein
MRFTSIGIVALTLVAAGCTRATPGTLRPSSTRALGDSLIALDSAMNYAVDNLDCAKGMSYVGDERPLFISGGHVVETHEQLLKVCQDLVAPRTGAQYVARSITAHVLSPSSGYVVRDGEYVVHMRNGETRSEHLSMTTIWSRQDGVWKMVHLHESAIRP